MDRESKVAGFFLFHSSFPALVDYRDVPAHGVLSPCIAVAQAHGIELFS